MVIILTLQKQSSEVASLKSTCIWNNGLGNLIKEAKWKPSESRITEMGNILKKPHRNVVGKKLKYLYYTFDLIGSISLYIVI